MISGRGRGKIRPPRRVGPASHVEMSEFENQWIILRSALSEIHGKNASQLSFEQIYRASYKIVLKKEGMKLYDRVREFEEQWFSSEVMPRIGNLITLNLTNIASGGISGVTANERLATGEDFMRGLKLAWEDHITTMNMTTDVLMYMDRVYCNDNRKASIFTTSMGLFRDHILRAKLKNSPHTTFDILNTVILDQIAMERDGDVIDKYLIKTCAFMLEGLYETDAENDCDKLYLTAFEPVFLGASRQFYQAECARLLSDSDASTWLRQTKTRLIQEENRCQTTISMLTCPKITAVVEEEMITAHLPEFLAMEGSGIKAMIANDTYDDIELLYQLIARVDEDKVPLKGALQAHVFELGTEINRNVQQNPDNAESIGGGEGGEAGQDAAKPKASKPLSIAIKTAAAIRWVDEVLTLKDKFDKMWKNCLKEDLILHSALTKSFSDFINMFPRCSEYVSLFIDENLKRGIKGKTETEVDEILEKAVTLLKYLQDKDLFERYYKQHLASRLLHGKSESVEVEKQMVSKMKLELGNALTSKLEGMFKDMSMSDDLTAGYRQHIENMGDMDRRRMDLGVTILTDNCWPMDKLTSMASREEDGKPVSCNWPSELSTLQESFRAFYLKERNGRKLTWLGSLGNAEIRCIFPPVPGKDGVLGKERRHEISMPTYGMIVLLLFNDLADDEALSYEEILERTHIPHHDLNRMLHTLSVNPKAKVLKKNPDNREVKPGDTFSFNAAFTSKNIKIKAPVVVAAANKVEGDKERQETEKANNIHRSQVIDTVIVRIMKARKTHTHQLLLSEVISQLSQRFKPNIEMMKKCIESLIEREYMERIEEAATPTYRYLA